MTEERRRPLPQKIVSWVDRRHFISVRSFNLYICMWMTWKVSEWAFAFAHMSTFNGLETAGVIAAVTAPVCALQGFVFGSYMKAKDGTP